MKTSTFFITLVRITSFTTVHAERIMTSSPVHDNFIKWVNPFVGTDSFGNMYPGSQIPFGGTQISPDTDEQFYKRLNSLFTEDLLANILGAHDIQGRIRAYWHGNEPCHQITYLYNYIKKLWMCRKWVRTIVDKFYGDTLNSLCDNDDCGQMSACYIFNCMKFYHVALLSNIYNIGSPCLKAIKLRISNNKELNIKTRNWSKENVYIDKMFLNGKPYTKSYITWEDIKDGADILFVMSKNLIIKEVAAMLTYLLHCQRLQVY